ncbi:protein phosphatase 2C domain-containing protein [Plantactinospora sp. B6F1]|uniref:protein phosphatase 2C domain-containing protein n=1 Tax=Plantactinospora sp. B6F1 TaxID=3158971 RepID=UPI00102B347D
MTISDGDGQVRPAGGVRELAGRVISRVRQVLDPRAALPPVQCDVPLATEPQGDGQISTGSPRGLPTTPRHPRTGPPVVIAPQNPATAYPPRFGRGSPAAARQWRLPAGSASPSGLAADQAVVGDLHVRGASVVGAGHRCEHPALPRQDAYRVAQDRDGRHLIIAVADGMADSSRAELGAQAATGQAVALVRRHLDSGRCPESLPATKLYERIASAMIQSAEERSLTAGDVRTTLTVAVVDARPHPDGSRSLWTCRLGDTEAWYRVANGWKAMIGGPKSAFDGNVLREFLPHYPDAVVQKTFTIKPGAVFAVMTDGVSDALAEVDGFAQWLHARWAEPPPLASFALDVDFDAPGQQDDRTSVVVWAGQSDDRR